MRQCRQIKGYSKYIYIFTLASRGVAKLPNTHTHSFECLKRLVQLVGIPHKYKSVYVW